MAIALIKWPASQWIHLKSCPGFVMKENFYVVLYLDRLVNQFTWGSKEWDIGAKW